MPATPSRRRLSALAALALALFGAGCLGDDDGGANGASAGADTTAAASPSTTGLPITTTTVPTTTTIAPTTTSTVAEPTTTTEPPPAPEPDVLEPGVEGERTAALQERLIAMHFDPGPVDGQFGTKTQQAVWAFQHTFGYEADGRVTPELWAAMLTVGAPEPLVAGGAPNRTEISIERQVLYVYRDGQVVLVTHISTGNNERYCENGSCGTAVTPTGDHAFERRISGWRESTLGRLYNPVYFYRGWAVHGSGSVPNHPASHGCVRIPMHIAEYFPDLVSNGDAVHVL